MALVNVANMVVLDNPAPFGNPLQFEITFECLQALEDGKVLNKVTLCCIKYNIECHDF